MASSTYNPQLFTSCCMVRCQDPVNEKLLKFSLFAKAKSMALLSLPRLRAILAKFFPTSEIHHLVENFYIFIFPSQDVKETFRMRGPWIMEGSLMSLAEWDIYTPFHFVKFDSVDAWVQIHQISDDDARKYTVKKVAKLFNKTIAVEAVDPDRHLQHGKFRMRVRVNVDKPLLPGCVIKIGPKREIIRFRYEKLPLSCVSCGIIGHEVCNDTSKIVMKSLVRYGAFLEAEVPPLELVDETISGSSYDRIMPVNRLDIACMRRVYAMPGGWDIRPYRKNEFARLLTRSVKSDRFGRWFFDNTDGLVPNDLLDFVFCYSEGDHKSRLIAEWEMQALGQSFGNGRLNAIGTMIRNCVMRSDKKKERAFVPCPFPLVDLGFQIPNEDGPDESNSDSN